MNDTWLETMNAAYQQRGAWPSVDRNYLFAGADSGGERAAAIYSLVGTAKLNGIDPEAYDPQPAAALHVHRCTWLGRGRRNHRLL